MTPVPEPVARIAGLMSTFEAQSCLCGGWAIDAWLGRQTREHHDVDISVFQEDQQAIRRHLAGWTLIAHDNLSPDATEAWDGRRLERPAHIHASDGNGFELEVILDERAGGRRLLDRERNLTLPLKRASGQSPWGVPTLLPEALLSTRRRRTSGRKTAINVPTTRSTSALSCPALQPDNACGSERRYQRCIPLTPGSSTCQRSPEWPGRPRAVSSARVALEGWFETPYATREGERQWQSW